MGKELSSKALLKMAAKLPEKKWNPLASDYIETIILLRDRKGLTWREVEQFFEDCGLCFSQSALQSVMHKAKRRSQ